jgi:hypothetical protein
MSTSTDYTAAAIIGLVVGFAGVALLLPLLWYYQAWYAC